MNIREVLGNAYVAFLTCFLSLFLFGLVLPSQWIILFSIICAYVISDLVINFFIIGGKGIAQIPMIDNQAKKKGHSYLAFFIGIIGSTIISSVLSDIILGMVKSSTDWIVTVFALSLGIGVAVFLDFEAKFYKRKN